MKRDRAISIQKPVCSDSIVSNPNSTASLWRLFQQHRSCVDSFERAHPVRFTPKSGHSIDAQARPLCAKRDPCTAEKQILFNHLVGYLRVLPAEYRRQAPGDAPLDPPILSKAQIRQGAIALNSCAGQLAAR